MSGGTRLRATAGGSVTMVADDTLTTDEVVEIETKGSIGYGQTWQDMTASRALDTLYTNTTGKPIEVIVGFVGGTYGSTTIAKARLVIDGVNLPWSMSAGITNNYDAGHTYVSAIVPNGSTYKTEIHLAGVLELWAELREAV